MAENQKFYNISDYSNRIEPGDRLKMEISIYPNREVSEISQLTMIPLEQLQDLREESATAEQTIFDNLRESAREWETQAANTLLLDLAIEYSRIPAIQHTSNQWENSEHDWHSISNMVYKMGYRISADTRYDRETETSIPFAWYVSWDVVTNSPDRRSYTKIAGQSRKRYTNEAELEKYIAGRVKAYSHLFTEISPPIPQEYTHHFRVNGQLLPGYTIEGEESNHIIPTEKERDTMFEPINIKISNLENTESAWLKLPATAEQFNLATERIGAQDDKFIISEVEPQIHLSAACASNAKVEELNHLAAITEDFTDEQVAKLNAIIKIIPDPEDINSIIGHASNIDFHELHPNITTHTELGEHVFEKSGLIQIPQEWAEAVDREKLGQLAAENEKGIFTEQGYIVESGEEWKPVTEIPEDYRIAPKIEYETAVAVTLPPKAQPNPSTPFILEANNPRDKLKEITNKLENGIKEIFKSEKYINYLKTLSKFHSYSMNNSLLIAMQNPAATQVAGFNAWQKDFKRTVKKGEKGMKIIAPAPFKAKKQVDKLDANGKPVIGTDGKHVKEEKEITVPAFTVATVFDVSQTEGEPLPQLGVSELSGNVDKYKEFFAAVEKTSPYPVDFEKIATGAKGYFHLEEKRIAINENMSELQNLKTLIHEVAHARIHDIDKSAPNDVPQPDRRTREVEAESIAYTVC